jgi:hypothetical protein
LADVKKPRPENRRRALSHVGGSVKLWGDDPNERRIVERALDVRSDEHATLAHVHGFHSYPARLHPLTAHRLIEGMTNERGSVLDPFCGSGTTLIEGRILGRKAFGSDVNPLAVELSRLRTRSTTDAERKAWLDAGARVVEHAEERRERRAGPTKKYAAVDRELFDIHVLLELDGIRDGIKKLSTGSAKQTLLLVLSAILTKVSRRSGDTAEERAPKRLATGYTVRLFSKKLTELAQKSAEFTALVPNGTPGALIFACDARSLEPVRPSSIDLIVCSPPYPGIYDYSEQHAHRLRWLGLDARSFRAQEIGARRRLAERAHDSALQQWKAELLASLAAMQRVLRKDGRIALILADAVLAERAVYADALVRELGAQLCLRMSSAGSQARPHFHLPSARVFRARPRAEHLLVLRHA